jgi:dUTP pyrophosphatase
MIKSYLNACTFIENLKYLFLSHPQLKIKLLNKHARIPYRVDNGSAGYDIFSTEPIEINPRTRRLIATGISTEFSNRYYLRVAPRSGLSLKGIDIGAGVIDSSYRGEIKVLVINNSDTVLTFPKGTKIAQLIMETCEEPTIVVSEFLSFTHRNENGFGSTGI